MRIVLILASTLFIALSQTASARSARDADATAVANCTFVTNVSAPVPANKKVRTALGTAIIRARADASKAGATDVVWDKQTTPETKVVSGEAYRCPK
jgi:hypothetical protein